MVTTEEIWKVHNHDRKSAYRNDGERQEWWGGLRYISITNGVKQGCCTGSHAFLYISVSNA